MTRRDIAVPAEIARGLGILEAHPEVRARFDLPHRTAAAELDLALLFGLKPGERMAKAVPSFPAIVYDTTVEWNQQKEVGGLLKKLAASHPLLEKAEIADLFHGDKHAPNDYSLTLRFTYRAADRTLTEDEVKKAHGEVLKRVLQ